MENPFDKFSEAENRSKRAVSVGHALRNKLFNKISPILSGSDQIEDSDTRLLIQANCLDLVSIVEELIDEYELD